MSRSRVRVTFPAPKNKALAWQVLLFFSNPKDWYVITLQRVCNCRRRMESPKVYYAILLIDYMHFFKMITYATQVAITFRLRRISYTPTVWFPCLTTTQCKKTEWAYWENCGIRKRNHRWWEIPMRAYILQACGVDECITTFPITI